MNVQKLSISKRGRLCAKLGERPAESTEVLEAAQPGGQKPSAGTKKPRRGLNLKALGFRPSPLHDHRCS